MTIQELDQIDHDIACRELLKFDQIEGPRVGDFVMFADNITRRISYVWSLEDWQEMAGVQTSDGGSWYFGYGNCDFSGSLHQIAKMNTLTLTKEVRPRIVWVIHHDWRTAGNDVHLEITFLVYKCS